MILPILLKLALSSRSSFVFVARVVHERQKQMESEMKGPDGTTGPVYKNKCMIFKF